MPIINQDIKFIHSLQIHAGSAFGLLLKTISDEIEFNDRDYWYVEIFNAASFKEELWKEALPADVINSLRKGDISLLINNRHEAFIDIVDPLYKLLICQMNINEDNIILLTGAIDILPEIKKIANFYSKNAIKVFWLNSFEFHMGHNELRNYNKITHPSTYQYKKKFVNLNRRWRTHRLGLVSLLIVNKLTQHGYISLIESADDNWDRRWEGMLDRYPRLGTIFNENKKLIVDSTHSLTVDTDDISINPPWLQPELNYIYQDSYFTVVSETTFFENSSRFFTEKTFKTIAHKHPFILLTRPHSLQLLRNIGYKTFSPLINESYDDELDDEIRTLMVLEEIKRLCNLSTDELKKFVDGTREICNHNYDTLLHNAQHEKMLLKLN